MVMQYHAQEQALVFAPRYYVCGLLVIDSSCAWNFHQRQWGIRNSQASLEKNAYGCVVLSKLLTMVFT